ncbi:MAG: DUF3784 domain-containing protein [Lachnospiraceae bacterium]|nr:DUF3784 domain-containing protein [Lachnospiraceae bacterium]
MFGGAFDWIMAVICVVCAVLLLSGHGDGLMKMFGSTSNQQLSMKVEKKRTKEQELRYQRAIGFYCAVLAVCEVVLALFGEKTRIVPLSTMAVAIAGLVLMVWYLRNKI